MIFRSLIAVMLGRLRMSVPQALAIYREVGATIFKRKRRRALAGMNILAARYNYKNVENVVKTTVQKHCKSHTAGTCVEDKLMWEDDKEVENHWHLCQAYVAANTILVTTSHTFTGFASPQEWMTKISRQCPSEHISMSIISC